MAQIDLLEFDRGIVIQATLAFIDFDPTGSTAVLEVDADPPRGMTLIVLSPTSAVVRYSVLPLEFTVGSHNAVVRVTKGAASVGSQTPLKIKVKAEP